MFSVFFFTILLSYVCVYINYCPIILGFKGKCYVTYSAIFLPCCTCRWTLLVKLRCNASFLFSKLNCWCYCHSFKQN